MIHAGIGASEKSKTELGVRVMVKWAGGVMFLAKILRMGASNRVISEMLGSIRGDLQTLFIVISCTIYSWVLRTFLCTETFLSIWCFNDSWV